MSILAGCYDGNRWAEEKGTKDKLPAYLFAIPAYAIEYVENWELLNKLNNELMSLEKTGPINYPKFFYQLLHYYYYDQPLIDPKTAAEDPTQLLAF
jgi:hypothetical protein